MNNNFQDRIDDYILGRMSAEEKTQFEIEISNDVSKKEQLEFTINVKKAISSRQEKMAALNEMKMMYDEKRITASQATGTHGMLHNTAPKKPSRRIWLWATGIAAIFIIGLLVITPVYVSYRGTSPYEETIRGSKDEVFDIVTPEKEYHRKGFGCSRKKEQKSNKDIKIIEEPIIIDSIALDTTITFGLR